jgi:hypothetical protein
MVRLLISCLALLVMASVRAEMPGVLKWELEQDLEIVYREVYRSLEDNNYYVIFEPRIGRNLGALAPRWGDEYNRNKLLGIRSLVFFNPWVTNQISNQDPDMLALCPMQITLYQKGAVSSILFARPTQIGAGSAAMPLLEEIESVVSTAIEAGLKAARQRRLALPPEREGGYIGNQRQPPDHQDEKR